MWGRGVTRPAGPVSSMLADAGGPLPRILDVLRRWPEIACGAVHVRAWRGTAPGGERRVVVLGELRGGPQPEAQLAMLAKALGELLIYAPCRPHAYHGVVSWQLARSSAGPIRVRFSEDRGYGIGEVERLVGQPVECYPPAAYTADTVEWFAERACTIEVEHDLAGWRPLYAATRTLGLAGGGRERRRLCGEACDALAEEIVAREMRLDRRVDVHGWNDGTTRSSCSLACDRPRVFAARLTRPLLPLNVVERVALLPASRSPAGRSEIASLERLLGALDHWREEVDEFANRPNPRLCEALATATHALREWLPCAIQGSRTGIIPRAWCGRSRLVGAPIAGTWSRSGSGSRSGSRARTGCWPRRWHRTGWTCSSSGATRRATSPRWTLAAESAGRC